MQNAVLSGFLSPNTSGTGVGGGEKPACPATTTDGIKKCRSRPAAPGNNVEARVPRVPEQPARQQHAATPPHGENFEATLIADKYLLLEQVEGSSLFRCIDVNTQEQLVCKVVSQDSHSLLSAHYRLDSHPRISSLHEVLVCNRHMYLVFPRSHGDLHSHVRTRKRLRESEAKKMFRQIAETVQVCHRNGIVLRDLKLRKFVFADEERTELKLESLEDAVVLEDEDSDWLHDKRGCPAYVSPEILKAGAHYSGKAADMWSLGVILYTMLVGRYPFNDSEHASLFAKISRGQFVIPECLSTRARCLIRALLRKTPSERITSEDIFHHPWLAREDRDHQSRTYDQLVPECSLYDDEL
ncbi:tribbles homolog 2 [Atheta coriaria]|uniref:tribbles homolog 2 n=1 Tax=Dalotia coriaria TaxID=877792 RepID=UPI0031F34F34